MDFVHVVPRRVVVDGERFLVAQKFGLAEEDFFICGVSVLDEVVGMSGCSLVTVGSYSRRQSQTWTVNNCG